MTLEKNHWGVYQLHEFVEFFNPVHRKERVRVSTGCRTLKDTVDKDGLRVIGATTWRARYIKELQDDDLLRKTKNVRKRLYDGLREFIDQDASRRLEQPRDFESIFRRLTGKVKGHPKLRNMLTEELTMDHMICLREQRLKAGLSASTWNKELYFLSGGLKWLAENKNCYVATINWKNLKLDAYEKSRFATVEEISRLFEFIPKVKDYPFYEGPTPSNASMTYKDIALLLFHTGARPGEIMKLRWPQFSDNEGVLRIKRFKVRKKKEHAEITINLSSAALDMLRRRKRNQRMDNGWESPWVFNSPARRGIHVNNLRVIQLAIDESGLNDDPHVVEQEGKFTPHSLRDSYASLLAQSGQMQLYEIQKLLGHSSPKMTQKYANLIPEDISRKAAGLFDSL